jgi:alkylation response protein AidB-like acyl-CoA dehydrogenase
LVTRVWRCELSFDGYRAPAAAILGGVPGKGFGQIMKGLETGRIQVAPRSLGVATAALEDALAYAQQRESFGQPADMEAGMAKLFASEVAMEIALSAVRIHG